MQDAAGRRSLDLGAGERGMLLGHRPGAVVAALVSQLQRTTAATSPGPDGHPVAQDLAVALGGQAGALWDCARTARAAVRAWAERQGSVLEASGLPASDLVVQVAHAPDGLAAVWASLGQVAQSKQRAALQAICLQRQIPLVVDASGAGDSAAWISAVLCGDIALPPSLLVLGPAINGGVLPGGAVLSAGEWPTGLRRPGVGALNCAAVEAFVAQIRRLGDAALLPVRPWSDTLLAQVSPCSVALERVGNRIDLDLHRRDIRAEDLRAALSGRYLLSAVAGPQVLRLFPPLTTDASELDWAAEQLLGVLS